MALRAFAFFAISALVIYHNNLASGLVSDDFGLLGKLQSRGYFAVWAEHEGGFFRPLTSASLWLDLHLLRAHAAPMHLENILLHGLNSSLVFLLTRSMLKDSQPAGLAMAGAAGLLFLAHPSHSEVVSWVSGRGDLLATCFGLLGVCAGLAYVRGAGRAMLGACSVALLASFLSKESALALPGLLLALALARWRLHKPRQPGARVLRLTGASLVSLAIYGVARYLALGTLLAGDPGAGRFDLPMGKLIGAFKRQLLRSSLPGMDTTSTSSIAIGVALGLLLSALVLLVLRRCFQPRGRGAFGIQMLALGTAFLATLLPVLGSRVELVDSQGERLIYLATVPWSIAIALAVAFLGDELRRARRVVLLPYALAIGFAISLQTSTARWDRAGAYARQILEVIRSESQGHALLVLNLPDNYEGAYVFRNGLQAALRTPFPGAQGGNAFQVEVLSACRVDRRGVDSAFAPSLGRPGFWCFQRSATDFTLRWSGEHIIEALGPGERVHIPGETLARYSDIYLFQGHSLRRVSLH